MMLDGEEGKINFHKFSLLMFGRRVAGEGLRMGRKQEEYPLEML